MESNAFEALRDATRESRLVGDKLRDLVGSSNRHGDLQVVRSSALRLIECVDQMIDYEQQPAAFLPPAAHIGGFRVAPPELAREHRRQPAPRKPAPESAAEQRGTNGRVPGRAQGAILKLLAKAPRSPAELIELTELPAGTVYQATGVMKKEGRIFIQLDEADGQKKWNLTEGTQ